LTLTTAAKLKLIGVARSYDGFVDIFGHRYRIERARVSFGGDPGNPQVDVRLVREFAAFTMGVELLGSSSDPELTLTASPPIYDESQLLAFVLGADPDDQRASERGIGERATGVAAGLITGQLQSIVRDRLPIDVLRVELGEEALRQTKLTVGKWISERLFLAYRHRFEAKTEENSAEALIEYWFWRRWLLEAYFGDRGAAGADILWIKRF
jgi:autotransporter translocation and assembly factor TamB